MLTTSRVLALIVFLALAHPHPSAASTLYAVTGSAGAASTLYQIDPVTGAVIATVGSTGFSHITGLDFDPISGTLYAVASTATQTLLLTLDPLTGAGTLVAQTNTASNISDVSFNSSGTLYGWVEPGSDDLATINLMTGAVSIVGNSGLGTARTGLDFNSSDQLFVKSSNILYELNPATGTVIGSIALTSSLVNALAFDDSDTLFSLNRTATGMSLYTIDMSTGVTTLVGSNNLHNISAMAFQRTSAVPEPGTLGLLGTGVVVGFLRRHRRSMDARAIVKR